MGRHPKTFTRADHRADIGKCPLLEDEPPFLPGTGPPLKTLPFLFHIYFSDRLPRARSGHFSADCSCGIVGLPGLRESFPDRLCNRVTAPWDGGELAAQAKLISSPTQEALLLGSRRRVRSDTHTNNVIR